MRVVIRFEDKNHAVEVSQVIREDFGAVEVLVSSAYALWNMSQREGGA